MVIDANAEMIHAGFSSPHIPTGIRFLPPYEPYLQLRDRTTLLPEKAQQRAIWRSTGNPGIVLADGRFVATWRLKKMGEQLKVFVELCIGERIHGT